MERGKMNILFNMDKDYEILLLGRMDKKEFVQLL